MKSRRRMPIIGFLPPAVAVPLGYHPADDGQSVAARSTCPKRVSKSLGRSSELTKDQVGQKVIGDPKMVAGRSWFGFRPISSGPGG
jgi:hypothetical protein